MSRFLILAYDGVIALDVFGIFDTLRLSDDVLESRGAPPAFQPTLCGLDLAPVRLANGARVLPECTLDDLTSHDTLVVPGCFVDREDTWRDVAAHLESHPPTSSLIAICTGAFILASAGLLDGHQATTHWAYIEHFATAFPNVHVQRDTLFVCHAGAPWTSAGVCAGLDLSLHLVRQTAGPEIAQHVAKMLVVPAQRAPSSTQHSAHLSLWPTADERFYHLQQFVFSHLNHDLSVPALARRLHMSPRHFSRQCKAHLGVTPSELVRRARVHAAYNLIRCTDLDFEHIAERVGLGCAEVMRRCTIRALGASPRALRATAQPSPPTQETSS